MGSEMCIRDSSWDGDRYAVIVRDSDAYPNDDANEHAYPLDGYYDASIYAQRDPDD